MLKKRIFYTETGRIVVKPCRDSITRERRKLKKMARMVADVAMTPEQVEHSYQSWRGGMKRLDAHRSVRAMDALYRSLFESLAEGGVLKASLFGGEQAVTDINRMRQRRRPSNRITAALRRHATACFVRCIRSRLLANLTALIRWRHILTRKETAWTQRTSVPIPWTTARKPR